MAEWHWELFRDDTLEGLPHEAVTAVKQLMEQITTRESMIFLDGASYTGDNPPSRTEATNPLMVNYLTDVRGERVVLIQVTWNGTG
ncbi:hypothetical protein [Streptomyces sp. NBC_01465]|uniref:hypothetical protein n=1 Tax=Streptomyces sp. NBC_01465 TaxID=2903878 RepID=UPI002E347BEE|nr:hypothetical protein [Streptomyces sp. NBC_01465]